ncbi:MAG: hypothetical protein L6Q97_12040 [Thermoanaerobaculia bacterium]|nr:hypothetical protein [Thermoanaerobaculia bacterium]
MKKILILFITALGLMPPVWGQGIKYDRVSILPSTHFVVAGNTHLVLVDMDFENNGVFDPGQGTVHFTGADNDSLLGASGTTFYNLVLDKSVSPNFFWIPPELPIAPPPPCGFGNQLTFQGAGSKIMLGSRDLVAGPGASIVGANPQNFIVTAGTGRLVKETLSSFTFPVGSEAGSYTPLLVTQNAQQSVGVRCLPHVLANGLTGNPLTGGVVDVSWAITQDQVALAPLSLIAQWNAADELPGFDGKDCGVSRSLGNADWDLAGANIGEKSGQGPFTMARTGVVLPPNGSGTFAVGSEVLMYPLRVGAKTWLQGAFNAGTGNMNDNLRTQQLIPQLEPYSEIQGFTHVGRGGGETVSNDVLGISGPQAVVDWMFVELRSGANSSTVLETRSALIRRDGQVVDVDGVSPVTFRGREAGDYYIALRHRNHLGVRSFSTLSLANDPALIFDFTTEQYNAYQGVQAFLGPNAGWGMFGGNANSNFDVKYSGPGNDQNYLLNGCLGGNKQGVLNNVYNTCDLNLNGSVRYSGPLNDQNFLLNTVLNGDKTKVITQPNF